MVASFLSAVTGFIAAHPGVAYAAVLLLALSESIPFFGAFIPGTAGILAISALVPSGIVQLWPLLVAASTGAIIGDGLSFWIGHHYHRAILERWPLNRHQDLVARSETFFARHGDKSVFIARFTPGVRAIVPVLAGMSQMSARRFYFANVLSALVWAPSHILPAVFVGAAFSRFGSAAKPLAILVILFVVIVWLVSWLVRLAVRRGVPFVANMQQKLLERAAASHSRWGRFALEFLDPLRPETRGISLLLLMLVASAWLFFGVLEDVVNGDPLVRADIAIYSALQELRSPPGDVIMLAITELGDTGVVLAVTTLVFLWLVWRRAWRAATFWMAAVGGASVLNTVVKVTLHRARPSEASYTGWSAFSFPSGHSTVNLVLYGFLAFLIARELKPNWRFPVGLAALTFAISIAFSRLYLGVHWFSDVIGGLAFGTVWLAVVAIFYLRRDVPRMGALGLALVAGLALALAGGTNVYRHHARDTALYAKKTEMPAMAGEDWWSGGWRQLPSQRIDLTGETEEQLTIQWAGDLHAIEGRLLAAGWRVPPPWASLQTLGWLSGGASPADLPVVPHLAFGQLPALTLIRVPGEAKPPSRVVLRLWFADLQVRDGRTSPLWLGSIVEEEFSRPFSLMTVSRQRAGNSMMPELPTIVGLDTKSATRSGPSGDLDRAAKVLLLRDRPTEPAH
ncbi:VTT domain-containing protein [Ensifer sp. 2TAB8]|uniref:bifunctional DedA family/phosphatase PAP2 family protein n=1 Tax=Ensifer sp. 2TAB8 TaxID=3233006 RepID=UPI003F909CDF